MTERSVWNLRREASDPLHPIPFCERMSTINNPNDNELLQAGTADLMKMAAVSHRNQMLEPIDSPSSHQATKMAV